jgi:hypothetical protein
VKLRKGEKRRGRHYSSLGVSLKAVTDTDTDTDTETDTDMHLTLNSHM